MIFIPKNTGAIKAEFSYLIFASILYWVLISILSGSLGSIGAISFLVFLHLSSIASLYFYWRIAPWGIGKYSSFGAILLIVSMLVQCIAILDILIFGIRISEWPSTIPMQGSYESISLKAEIISQTGLMLAISSWRIALNPVFIESSSLKAQTRQHHSANMDSLFYGCSVHILLLSAAESTTHKVLDRPAYGTPPFLNDIKIRHEGRYVISSYSFSIYSIISMS